MRPEGADLRPEKAERAKMDRYQFTTAFYRLSALWGLLPKKNERYS